MCEKETGANRELDLLMSMSNRLTVVIVGFLIAVLVAAGTTYRIYTTRAGYLLDRGRAALERGNWSQADRYLDYLEKGGYPDHAHLLRGEIWLSKGRLGPATSAAVAHPTFSAQNSYRLALHELAQIKDEGHVSVEGTVLGAECLVHLGERRFAAE